MRILAALLCSSLVLAQAEPGLLRYVPKDADFVVRMAGPAKFAQDFAGTNLGKALSDPEVMPFWGKLVAHYQTQMELDADGPSEEDQVRMAKLLELLKGYSGEVVFAVRGDWEAIAETDDMIGAAIFAWSGGQQGAEITKLVTELLPDAAGGVVVGGANASLREGKQQEWLGPMEHAGNTVLIVGQELQSRARCFFEDLPEPAEVAAMGKGSFAMVMRLQRLMKVARNSMMRDMMLPVWVSEQLGLDAVEECSFFAYPDGKFVAQEIELRFNGKPRGLVGVMCPPKGVRPELLDYRPADASSYAAAPFDIAHLQKLYETTFANYADELPMDRATLEQMFTKMTKLDLTKDVLAHIGNGYMRIDDLSAVADIDEDEPESVQNAKEQISEACYVVKLNDGKAFAKSLDTAIRARGLHVARKREAYGDHKIYRMTLLGMLELEYVVTDSLLVVGVGSGEGTKRNLRGVIDAGDAVANGDAPEFRSEVAMRIAQLPNGWGGIQVGSLVEILDVIIDAGETLKLLLADGGLTLDDVDDPWELMLGGSRALKKVMNRHDAGLIVNIDYFEKDRYVMRSRW